MSDWRTTRDAQLVLLEGNRPPPERTQAADELCSLAAEDPSRAEELGAALLKLLADVQPEVRARGLELAVLTLEADEAADVCAARLSDPSDLVRLEATGRLADLALPQTRGQLARALEDDVPAVRFEAARGMASLHHSAGLEVLTDALDDSQLRFRALGAIAELGDKAAVPAVRKVFGKLLLSPFEKTQAAGVLARFGEKDGADYLFKRAKKKWTQDRALALEILGEVKAEGAFDVLQGCVQNPKDTCRGAAARGLGRLKDSRAVPTLTALLTDQTQPDDLRLDAAEGLLHLGTADSKERVKAALPTFKTEEAKEELAELLLSAEEDLP